MITFKKILSAWRNVEPDFKDRDKAVHKDGITFTFDDGKTVGLTPLKRLRSEEVEEMAKIERIECHGASNEIWFFPKNLTLGRWDNFLENHRRGNSEFIKFQEKDGRVIIINPSHWGSVRVKVYNHD